MPTVTKVGFRQSKGRGIAKAIVNVATLTGNYVGGLGVAVTPSPSLDRVDWAMVELLSGFGQASGKIARVGSVSGAGFYVTFWELQSGVPMAASGYGQQLSIIEAYGISGQSVSGSQVRYIAIGE
jgi:hypothetical protein